MTAALSLRGVSASFGGLVALSDVTFDVEQGAVVALVGPNGAGKSTLLNCVSGLIDRTGTISLAGVDISRRRPSEIAAMGVGRSLQTPALMEELTVLENVLCGAHTSLGYGPLDQLVRRRRMRAAEAASARRALELLDLVQLRDAAQERVSDLSFGARKLVDIVRAAMGRPSLLLLDEPSSGLGRADRIVLHDLVRAVRGDGSLSVLIVEHDMNVVRAVATDVVALQAGRLLVAGAAGEVIESEVFRSALLGRSPSSAPTVAATGARP